MDNVRRWYVYHLVDPRDGCVFYVGKGSGDRIRGHEVEARRGVTSKKCQRIRDIWDFGLPIERRVVRVFEVESDAFAFERAEIHRVGVGLTNVVDFREPQVPLTAENIRVLATLLRLTNGARTAFEASCSHPIVDAIWKTVSGESGLVWVRDLLKVMVDDHGKQKVFKRLAPYGICEA